MIYKDKLMIFNDGNPNSEVSFKENNKFTFQDPECMFKISTTDTYLNKF